MSETDRNTITVAGIDIGKVRIAWSLLARGCGVEATTVNHVATQSA